MTDSRSRPAYTVAEAARYLTVPVATLRAWTVGRPSVAPRTSGRIKPLIRLARKEPGAPGRASDP
jgi:hypothetical protein